jgi:hypothetical protein
MILKAGDLLAVGEIEFAFGEQAPLCSAGALELALSAGGNLHVINKIKSNARNV